MKIEPTRFSLALSAPAPRSAPLDRFVRSAQSALPVLGTAAKLAMVPPLLYAGALGGAVLAAAATGGFAPVQAALGSGGLGQLLSLAPTAGKAGMVLGSLPALGLFIPKGARPGNLSKLLAGVGMLACAAGAGLASHSGGMVLPAVAALATLAGGAGALGGYRLGGSLVGVLNRLFPNRIPEEKAPDPRQVVSDLANGLKANQPSLVQESERQVVLGGVTLRRRQAVPGTH